MTQRTITQSIYATIGGICLGFLLIYLGINATSWFNVGPSFGETVDTVENLIMLIALSITFGFYLAKAFKKGSTGFTVFTASALGILTLSPLIVYGLSIANLYPRYDLTYNIVLAMLLPFLIAFSLIGGNLFADYERAKSAFNRICTEVLWYIFGVHLIYAFEYPVAKAIVAQIGSLDAFTFMSFIVITIFVIGFFFFVNFIAKLKQTP